MTARGRDEPDGKRGQILAMMIISLLALCAVVAVAADVGFFFDYRRRMQTAADAAAMAGAHHVRRERLLGRAPNLTDVQNEGYKATASNGFTNGANSTQVTVNWPPLSGRYANDGFVEAIVTQPRPTVFMAILGFQSATVTTRAVAGIKDSDLCVLALQPTLPKAINMNGSFSVTANCRIADNSNDSDALDDSGGACMIAKSIAVTGTAGGNGTCFTPPPTNNAPREPDPFAARAAPTFSLPCNYSNQSINGAGTWTLSPGVYCGGIRIQGQGGSGCPTQVTFQPGTYVLYGGGLDVNGGCLTGTDVTFYNTGTTSGANQYSRIQIQGNVTGGLYAPTTGSMVTMLFFQDRAFSGGQANIVNGNTGLTLQGTLYFPTTPVTFAGGASSTGAAAYTILVAGSIKFTGGATFNDDFSSLPGGSPLKTVALAE